jgi:hypothetical protein
MFGLRSVSRISRVTSCCQIRHGTSIPVILLEEMEARGFKGEVVQVKRGFARNYLIPRKMAGKFIY